MPSSILSIGTERATQARRRITQRATARQAQHLSTCQAMYAAAVRAQSQQAWAEFTPVAA